MKESPTRYINPFLSDEENEKLNLWNQELENSNIEHDCEKESDFYTDKNVMECELPELLICYKDGGFHVKDICVDEGIHHEEKILFDENNNNKMLNLEDYYMESNLCSGNNVKFDTNFPVLEPSNDHMNIGNTRDEVIECKSDEVDADLSVNGSIKEEVLDSIDPNELKKISDDDSNDENGNSKYAPDGFVFYSESVTVSNANDDNDPDILKINSSDDLSDNVSKEQLVSNSGPTLEQDRVLPSLKSLIESIDQQIFQNPVEEILKIPDESVNTVEENDTLNLKDTKPATSGEHVHKIENLEHVDELLIEPNGAPKVQETGSDKVATVNPIHRGECESSFSVVDRGSDKVSINPFQRGEGESSFSVAGHGSEHITYSGPIAFSGSASIRSDSSTTSTRSFAFPILPNEWNSSPVRMAKADRRRLQKHRGWRHGLLCCRF